MNSPINNHNIPFHTIFNTLPLPTYVWRFINNNFELIDANDAATTFLNHHKKDFIGVTINDFFVEDTTILADFNTVLNKKISFECEKSVTFKKNNKVVFLKITYTFIDEKNLMFQTEEVLNQQKKSQDYDYFLASFIKDNPAALAMFDLNMNYIAVSHKWITRFKLDKIDLIGKSHYDIFPEISDDWKEVHKCCLNGAIEKRDEDLFVRLNGDIEWEKWEILPWYKNSGEIGGIITYSEHITERKNAEEKIKKDAEKLNTILENLPFGMSIENENDESTFFNKTLIDILGYTIEDVPNTAIWLQKVYPNEKYRAEVIKKWNERNEKSKLAKTVFEPIQTTMCCKNGSYKVIESYYVLIDNEYITLYQDVTEIRKTELKLKETNKQITAQNEQLIKAKALVEESEFKLLEGQKAAKIGSWETDLETLNISWSQETFRIFELNPDTFSPTYQLFLGYVHPEDKSFVEDAFFKSFQSKEYTTIQHKIITSKGKEKYVEEYWKVSFNEKGVPVSVLGTCQDITESKLIELELIKTKVKIQENEQRLSIAVDAAKLGIFEWYFNDGTLVWDDIMYEIYGFNKNSGIDNYDAWLHCLHPDDKEQTLHEIKLAIEEKKMFDTVFRIIKSNGEIAYIKGDALLVKDENNVPFKLFGVNRDVTEKNLREKELKDKELKYRTLFETSVDAIILFADGKNVDCNESALKLFGTTREHFLSWPPKKYSPKYQSDGTLSEDDIKKRIPAVFEGKSQHFEWEHCKEDGTVFLAEVRLNLIEIEGKPYIQALIRDITNAKIIENKLNEFRYFFEKSNDLLSVTNVEGYFEYVNTCFQNTLQYSEEELRKKEYDEIFVPEFIDNARKKAVELRSGIPLENYSAKMLKKNGESSWVEWNVFINEISGKFYSIGRDISERKKHEEQLAISSLIVNSTHDAIMAISNENIITSWNNGAEKMFGYKASEIVGKPIFQLMTPSFYKEHGILSEKIQNKELLDHFETLRVTKTGEEIHVSLTLSPIVDEDGNVIATSKIMRNISLQKNIENEKVKIMNDLIQRNRDLEQFTNIVSHNLRAPVANIIGLNNYMLTKDLIPEKKKELDVALNKSVLNLDNVIRDLNNILQIRKSISEQKTIVKFSDLVEKISTSISNQINSDQVRFVLDFNEVSEMITIKSYLYSIFYNLITNSIKYKQFQVNPVIEIKSALNGKNIVLFFKDNGLGFDKDKNQEQIFGLYKRFHMHVDGKGLGLFMVKSQVESLGGKISVSSEINKGTEFKIEFEL